MWNTEHLAKQDEAFEELSGLKGRPRRSRAVLPARKEEAAQRAKEVLLAEAEAVKAQLDSVDAGFTEAALMVLSCAGRVIVSGMGKSGLVGRKIAATLASTGTPSFFMHPSEALHGDLGMAARGDLCLVLSASGETEEIKKVLPAMRAAGLKIIALTCRRESTLWRAGAACIEVRVKKEACLYNLAPTASTTAMLALGDALALAVMDLRGFGREDFAKLHPGGALGRRLNARVEELMRSGAKCPEVEPAAPLSEALVVMTGTRLGAVCVIARDRRLLGFFTDGDLRRVLAGGLDLGTPIKELMTRHPLTIQPGRQAGAAAAMMRRFGCDNIPVTDASGKLLGILDEKDLIDEGISA